MILPRGFPGVAFGEASDGDGRHDLDVRERISTDLGISTEWALIDQVHGCRVVWADVPGHLGEADGIVTARRGLPLAVATADCVPIVLVGTRTVAVVHAGWRGVAGGVATSARRAIAELGDTVQAAVIGPHIGPCCYEVGSEVLEAVEGFEARTTEEKVSVDLGAAIRSQLAGVETLQIPGCTAHDEEFNSYRRTRTPRRQVTVAWIP